MEEDHEQTNNGITSDAAAEEKYQVNLNDHQNVAENNNTYKGNEANGVVDDNNKRGGTDGLGPQDREIVVGLLSKGFDISTSARKRFKRRKLSPAENDYSHAGEASNQQLSHEKVKVSRKGRVKGSKNKNKRIKDIQEMGQTQTTVDDDRGLEMKKRKRLVLDGNGELKVGRRGRPHGAKDKRPRKRRMRRKLAAGQSQTMFDEHVSGQNENDQTGGAEQIIDENNAGESGNGNGTHQTGGGAEDIIVEDVAGESGNRSGTRKLRSTKTKGVKTRKLMSTKGVKKKPRLIVAGEILAYSEVKKRKPRGDPDTPRRPRGRPKKYIPGTRTLIGERAIHHELNAEWK
ncbi:uncharacterized protein LOC143632186 [Bidens hawaiensis]|uniref:uncharacterized protein LOC143632186 n=1 Tax=Bidens hawaiensis TaxID=980011 RepID=UPI004049B2F2